MSSGEGRRESYPKSQNEEFENGYLNYLQGYLPTISSVQINLQFKSPKKWMNQGRKGLGLNGGCIYSSNK